MNIIKYLFSRSYRKRFHSEYTREFSNKLDMEQKKEQSLYEIVNENVVMQ